MLITNVPLMIALFIIVVSCAVLLFKSEDKDAKEEREYYDSLSEREKREYAMKYNKEHGITPTTIKKAVRDLISISKSIAAQEARIEKDPESMDEKELKKVIADTEKLMRKAAADLNFEAAAELRDKLLELKKHLYN